MITAGRIRDEGIAALKQGANGTSADDIQVSGNHYKDMPIQPWHIMEAVMDEAEFRGFLCGNVIKYSLRAGRKEGSDDAGKAKHYMQKLKEFDEKLYKMRSGKTRE